VLQRTRRFVNASIHSENAWFVAKCIAFTKMMVVGMRGIVKILLRKVRSFYAVATMQKLAHHFLATLKNVDSVVFSGTEFSTFNPFVVGSTPARPTTGYRQAALHLPAKRLFYWCAAFNCPGTRP
jgi:hypothetical protein